mgnify:CR=1 FL=1
MFQLPRTVVCCQPIEGGGDATKKTEGAKELMDDISDMHVKEHTTTATSKKKSHANEIMDAEDEKKECQREDCTALLKAIEDKHWDNVMTLILTGKTNEFSFFGIGANNNTEPDCKTQAKTWVIGKDWWGNMTWRKLPIHAAIMNHAPLEVVKKLHSLYPRGAQSSDLDGNLCLHLSFKHEAPDNVTAFLLKVFPEAVGVTNNEGRTPVEYATGGAGEIINLCIEQTNLSAKREEAKLNQALESEKSRLTEILMQLADIRDELEHLRKTKKKVSEGTSVSEKSESAANDEVAAPAAPSEGPVDSAPPEKKASSKKKKNTRSSSKKRLPWNKQGRVADESGSPPSRTSGMSKKK